MDIFSGLSEIYDGHFAQAEYCRCVTEQAPLPPSFVRNHYFCESGRNTAWVSYPDDPLWDGQNCVSSSCCEFNYPPYFTRALPASTSDDIELCICVHHPGDITDNPIDQVELYVN